MTARIDHPLLVLKSLADDIAMRLRESQNAVPQTESHWSALAFRCGQEYFLIAADDVQEVVASKKMGKFTPIPQAKSWLKGLVQLRGDLFPIIDFGGLVRNEPSKNDTKNRIIVVKPPLHFGFVVDEVCGVQPVPLELKPTVNSPSAGRFFTGTFQKDNLTYKVFSHKHAARDAELRNFTTNQ